MTHPPKCLVPGCHCFDCKLLPSMERPVAERIITLESQLKAQRAIVAADDVLFVDELRLKLEASRPSPNQGALETILEKLSNDIVACRQTREAAKLLDKKPTPPA